MKVLVTGGAGFIGSHVAELLAGEGVETVVVDNFSSGRPEHVPAGVRHYQADIVSTRLRDIFAVEKPQSVIHQAAQVDVQISLADPFKDAVQNLLGTLNVLTCCRDYGVHRFIYASSCAVYGETADTSISENHPARPFSFYGLSKYTGEQYVRLFHEMYGLPYVILRYANVYGPRQGIRGEGAVIPAFITRLLAGKRPVIYGSGAQTRDFVYAKDVARANLLALRLADSAVFNIGTNQKTNILALYRMITHALSSPLPPLYQPMKKGDLLFSCLQNEKAKALLGWQPHVGLEEGLEHTIRYYRQGK